MTRNFGNPHGGFYMDKPVYRPSVAAYLLAAALWVLIVGVAGWAMGWL